ncbi:MAG: tRNA (adenosine(37)-N6)-dimethylallyltransferase MiaA [Lentisphaeria bacterium]|nr:tRNA (adenosine(37)-N6)-dimethylallyltransferase MiaA [Lentisphaeria bacterium]
MEKKLKLIAITGPTATGKTSLAVRLARFFDGEIISLDSRQLYRTMDIGSGKDLSEYGEIPYHLIDIAHPSETVDLARVLCEIQIAIKKIASKNKTIFLCGGTALYLESLLKRRTLVLEEENPELRAELNKLELAELVDLISNEYPDAWNELNADDRRNPLRIRRKIENAMKTSSASADAVPPWMDFEILTIGVYLSRNIVRENISKRLDVRFENGMTEEIRKIHDEEKVSWEKLERFGLEYREISRFLQGKCTEDEMKSQLLNKIRQFAKRQDIFFRKIEREGFPIHWFDAKGDIFGKSCKLIETFLADGQLPPPEIILSAVINPKKLS